MTVSNWIVRTAFGGILCLLGCAGLLGCAESPDAQQAVSASSVSADIRADLPFLQVDITHGETPNDYRFSWESVNPVNLFVSEKPSATAADLTMIGEALSGGSYEWRAPGDARRLYFLLTSDGAADTRAAVRLLPLEGGRNFRDLGGYRTDDGRSVRWGRVYRSGTMNRLTDGDYDYLARLNIAAVCDYRSAQERQREPTVWRGGETAYLTFPDPASPAGADFMSVLQRPDATPEAVAAAMADSYAQIAKQHAHAYAEMFDQLAAGNIPLAFNCSAGKDRAGLSAALLLTALGVDEEQVVQDYASSEQYVDYVKEFLQEETDEGDEADNPYAFLQSLPVALVTPLMRSDPAYATAALRDLADEFGSVMTFIRNELKVTDAELNSIRTALLE